MKFKHGSNYISIYSPKEERSKRLQELIGAPLVMFGIAIMTLAALLIA